MLFYIVFVAFVGIKNKTILAMQNIEFASVSSDRYPDPAEKVNIEAIPILNINRRTPSIDGHLLKLKCKYYIILRY